MKSIRTARQRLEGRDTDLRGQARKHHCRWPGRWQWQQVRCSQRVCQAGPCAWCHQVEPRQTSGPGGGLVFRIPLGNGHHGHTAGQHLGQVRDESGLLEGLRGQAKKKVSSTAGDKAIGWPCRKTTIGGPQHHEAVDLGEGCLRQAEHANGGTVGADGQTCLTKRVGQGCLGVGHGDRLIGQGHRQLGHAADQAQAGSILQQHRLQARLAKTVLNAGQPRTHGARLGQRLRPAPAGGAQRWTDGLQVQTARWLAAQSTVDGLGGIGLHEPSALEGCDDQRALHPAQEAIARDAVEEKV